MFPTQLSSAIPKVEIAKPVSIRLKVTGRCPWRCRFCHKEGSPHSQDLSLNEAVLLAFRRFYNVGFREIHLTGGEPSWYPECERLVSILHNMGFRIKMTSNGQFDIGLLRRLADAGLYSINFSVHTLNPEKLAEMQSPRKSVGWGQKALETQIQNLRVAREMGLKVKINTVVQDRTEDALEVIDFCRREGIELRLLNDLGSGSLSKRAINEALQSLGAEIEMISLIDGVSAYSCQMVTNNGFHFSVKAIRRCSLRTICERCDMKNQCEEQFYGVRIEQVSDRPMVRLCLHKQGFPYVQTIDNFFCSEQFAEIQELLI